MLGTAAGHKKNMPKAPPADVPTDADLKGNPMIGGSAGVNRAGQTPDDLEDSLADTTIEGDTANGTNAAGGLDKNAGTDGRK